MILVPFKEVKNVPRFEAPKLYVRKSGDFSDINYSQEFIDVAKLFILKIVRGIRETYSVGLTAFMFDGRLSFDFDQAYNLVDVSFCHPFTIEGADTLTYNGINLFQPTLLAAKTTLDEAGIKINIIDVGFEAPDLGVSFFSDEYESDLNVRLDAVTVHFTRPD